MKFNTISFFKLKLSLLAICSVIFFYACKSEPDYKEIRQEVVDLHDKLMADGEVAVHSKMHLDTVAAKLPNFKIADPKLDTAAERKQINHLIEKLNVADESMMDWMQAFKADVEGMGNTEAVAYFKSEKTKLVKMDSLYKVALHESESYLKKFGIEVHPTADGHDHSKH